MEEGEKKNIWFDLFDTCKFVSCVHFIKEIRPYLMDLF
jgi:hypothetical protein